jgi:acyl-CoA synthetase (AMP-forming)/AMP-acid ligase II
MLIGRMQETPLLVSSLIAYAERFHAQRDVVSRFAAGATRRLGWGEVGRRARQLASALLRASVRPGDRVATLAMNHHRHLELYYAVSGIGVVLHTVNPRWFEPQLAHLLRHGGARWIFADPAFLPLLGPIECELPELRHRIVRAPPAEVPNGATSYEDFLATGPSDFDWPALDESAASMATLDGLGFLNITDRSKDLIKSGGEWIGSLEIETVACSMPGVHQAAAIAARHPRWEEQPLLLVVPQPASTDVPTPAAVLCHLRPRIASWWLPDAVLIVEDPPLIATGKIDKEFLRERYGEYLVRHAAPGTAIVDGAHDAAR